MQVSLPTHKLRRLRPPFVLSRASLLLPFAVLFAWWAGAQLGSGSRQTMLLGLGAAALAAPIVQRGWARRVGYGAIALEVPVVLLLLSTLVFRQRSADELAYNPLDPAAQFRVLCVLAALALGTLALTSTRAAAEGWPTTRPFRLYALYVLVVFAGAPLSVNPSLTAYRGVELLAAVIIMAGAWRTIGTETIRRTEAVLYWFVVALVASVWLGVALFPGEAVHTFANTYVPIQFQVSGVNPILSSNSVGTLGMTLAVWSIARARWPIAPNLLRPSIAYGLAALGVATLLVAQYRTGYVALVVAVAVLLMIRRKWLIASLLVIGATAFVLWNPSVVTKAEPYILRGQTVEQARELSDRVNWWGSAIRVWGGSPVIGKGLLTATRFEVLAPLGETTTSTIHSTWIEALVGTGVIGLSLLGLAYLIVMKRAFVEAVRGARPFALILLTMLSIRTITGNSFESFSFEALLFLFFALHLQDHRAPSPP